jgi:hypothetical protein
MEIQILQRFSSPLPTHSENYKHQHLISPKPPAPFHHENYSKNTSNQYFDADGTLHIGFPPAQKVCRGMCDTSVDAA